MNIEVAHFVDAGEQDAEGCYNYYLDLSCRQLKRSALARDAARYLAARGVTTFRCLGSSAPYKVAKFGRS